MSKPTIADLKAKMQERDDALRLAHQHAQELRDMVDNSGMSVSELARRLGVTRGTIYTWKKRGRTD